MYFGERIVLINKRRRLVGLLLAIAVPAVVGALALPANAITLNDPLLSQTCTNAPNLVSNCGFEAGTGNTASGWQHLVSLGSGVFNVSSSTPAAHSGNNILSFYSTSGDDVWTQNIRVSPHTTYLISAWVYSTDNGSPTNDDLTISATNIGTNGAGTVIYETRNTNLPWTRVGEFVTTGSGSSMTLTLSGANVPSHTWVDDVSVIAQRSGCAAIANNLVENCGFENATVDPWALTPAATHSDSQLTPDSANGGAQSLRLAAWGGQDDVWKQVLTVRPHTQYTLTYWVEYWSAASTPNNHLKVSVTNVPAASGGILAISTTNAANHFWAKVSATFTTGNGSTSTLSIAGQNTPDSTFVDDVSVTAVPHIRLTHSGRATTTTLTGLGGQRVHLEKLVSGSWRIIHTWTAPKTGWSKSWAYTVGSGGTYRSVSDSAPGYSSAISAKVSIS